MQQGNLFELEDKVSIAVKRIRQFCDGRKTLVAFSGGKDSQCCYHLCEEAGIDFHAEYSITRFEPPEAIRFMLDHYPAVTYRRAYKMSLVEEIEYRGLPTRWNRWCCNYKHIKTAGYDIAVIGVRAAESPRRRDTWRMFGQKPDKSWYLCPVFDWTDEDVWAYLNSRKIPHCCLYDEGFKRVGCVCCPLAVTKKRTDAQRWPKTVEVLYQGFLRFWRKSVANGGVTKTGKPVRALEWACPRDCFDHWVKTGGVLRDYKPEKADEPCAFAGTGYSESDGLAAQRVED